MVEAIAWQLDRCSVCGLKVHRRDLVRTQVEFLAAEASNYLTYSTYNTSGWATDGSITDRSTISVGPYADRARVRVADDNTLTEILGSQTWSGSGYFYSSSAIDASSWDSLVFSADVGPYHRSTAPSTVFTLALCDSDGTNAETLSTFTTKGDIRAWGTINIADLPAGKTSSTLYFRISVVPQTDQYWWVDRLQVEKDATKLGTFVPTSGSSVDRNDTSMMTMRKVCTNCRERILSKSERFNKVAEIRTDQPVSVDIQDI